ncbi:MAG: NADH-quinone oxidoreductase subunit NuoE [bacterium]|nr:MAG: NADH-quinone oxidoreductase subunit NuoE [bacterium]
MEASPVENLDTFDKRPLLKILKKYAKKKGILIPLLQETQKIYGYLPRLALVQISEATNTDISQVYGVATFYAQFRLAPVGKHLIRVCHGTACHVSGATRITEVCEEEFDIKDGETSKDLKFTLESVACLGCCSLAPVMTVDDNTYGRLTDREVRKVVEKLKK